MKVEFKTILKFRLPKQILTIKEAICLTSEVQEIIITMASKDVLTTIKITEEIITIEIRITIQEVIRIKDQITHQIEIRRNQNKK